MPNKTQEYLNLAQQTAKELTRQLCRPAHDLRPAA